VVLEEVSLVNAPGPEVLTSDTVNSLALVMPVTLNLPLKPELAVPTGLLALTMFLISTSEPILRLWGSSVKIFATLLLQFAPAMNLKSLCSLTLPIVTEEGLKYDATSVSVAPVALEES
jgi:hypothetical protein